MSKKKEEAKKELTEEQKAYELEKEKYHGSNGKILKIETCIQTNIRLKQYRLE